MEVRNYTSGKTELEEFLQSVHDTICNSSFNPYGMTIILRKKSEQPLDRCTTENTLMRLEYDKSDVAKELLALGYRDYAETCFDDIDQNLPKLFVFYRRIQNEDIYIKFRINCTGKDKICCLSFHRARWPVDYEKLPYRHNTW